MRADWRPQRWTLGSGGAQRGGGWAEGILRAAAAVEREQRSGCPGAGAQDSSSPPGLRSLPYAFLGQRRPDAIRAQSIHPTGGAARGYRRGTGKGSGPLTPTRA